jgi:hypothetical protein
LASFSAESGRPCEQWGSLRCEFSTGQALHVPIRTLIRTPYLAGSSPRLSFGTCYITRHTDGLFLLRNPTEVEARWTVEHVVNGGIWGRTTAIRVGGFVEETVSKEQVDEPEVFKITPQSGVLEGPTLSTSAAIAAPAKDFLRR